VGDDAWGRWLRGRLEREGIDLRWFLLIPAEETVVAFAVLDGARPLAERAVQNRGGHALVAREVDVATRHRQPVGLAHRRAAHHLDREREIEHEASDHRQLLEVLLAEVGAAHARYRKQLGDDSGDAVEVAGSRRAVQHLGHTTD